METEEIIERYMRFMDHPIVHHFVAHGGMVHVATEYRPTEDVLTLYRCGHRHFSEKRVQQAALRANVIRRASPEISLHYYGHLQRNKCRGALQIFDTVETIDRPSLAHRIAVLLKEPLPVVLTSKFCVQINTGKEPQKSGVHPDEAPVLIEYCLNLGLPIVGLMAIPPRNEDPVPHFRFLRRLADRYSLQRCQMGMSDDWRIAIDEGATDIRIGRLLFGGMETIRRVTRTVRR